METIGKYKVLRVLGRGGMGTVYEALDPLINRKVAIKTMIQGLADTPELRERFLREAQAAGGLRHRNIVTVYDLGEDEGGQPYIAMEYIEGTDIEKLIQNREPLSMDQKLDVLRQVCDGLGYAHRSGIVHRDIKPANIRLTPEGDVKIMDFGIAHLQSSTMTKSGLVLGTVHYMAPEQIDGHKVDHRADIFSVGAIAYEFISYRKPFEGDSLTSLMFKIMHERPDPVHLPRTAFSPRLEGIVMKALARDLQDRYQTLDAMHDDLERLQRDHGRPASSPGLPRSTSGTPPPAGAAEATPPARGGPRLIEEGRRRLESGDTGAALELAQQALAIDPLDSGAQALLREAEGEALGRRVAREMAEIRADMERARTEGQLQKALSLGKRLLELDPDDASVARETATIQATIQDREIEQLCGLALAYAADGDVDLALKITGKIERIDARNARYLELKTYLLEQASLRKAEVYLTTAREQLSVGNLEQAREAADRALAVHPGHGPAREIRDAANRILIVQGKGSAAEPTVNPPPAGPPPPAPPPAPAPVAAKDANDDDFAPVDLAVLEDSETGAAPVAAPSPAPGSPAMPAAPPSPAAADSPRPVLAPERPVPLPTPRPLPRAPSPFAARPAPPLAVRTSSVPGEKPASSPGAASPSPAVALPPATPPSRPLAAPSSPQAAPPPSSQVPPPSPQAAPPPSPQVVPPSPVAAPRPAATPTPAASPIVADPTGTVPSPPPESLTPIPEGEPTNPEAARLVESARRHLRERSTQNALPLLEQAAGLEPTHAGIQRLLVRTRAEARRAEIEALTTAALEHFVQNDSGKARRAVERALALDPQNRKAKELSKILGVLG